MRNTRTLILPSLLALAALAPLSAYAFTYTTYGVSDSEDIIKTTSPVESTFGYNMTTSVTIPSSVPPSTVYTITISGTTLGSHSNTLWCDNSGGGHTTCGGANAQGYAQKGGSGPIIYGSGTASGNVTSGASGSDSIKVFTDVWASNGWGCTDWSGACSVPAGTNYLSVPISAAPPTVSIWFN